MGVIIFLTACFSLVTGLARRLPESEQSTIRTAHSTARPVFGCTAPAARLALSAVLAFAATLPATHAAAASGRTILVYGDSLSAAYGISQKDGWPSLLQQRLRKSALNYTVTNASISGETSSGGAARVAAVLSQHKPKITIVALGSNDGLRGLPVTQMRDNLAVIIRAAQKAGSKVVLVGMRMPPNYGAAYTQAFENTYLQLARQFRLPLAPFLLDGVADRQNLFQPDQLHPLAEAQPLLLDNVWKALRTVL